MLKTAPMFKRIDPKYKVKFSLQTKSYIAIKLLRNYEFCLNNKNLLFLY